jgi:exosortase H (IPTLxxWG-CTERM-specific)
MSTGVSWNSFKARWFSWYANTGSVWRFGLKFGALMVVFYILILTPFCDRLLYTYLGANAWLANGLLNWLGQATYVSDITIRSAQFAITVRRGCDAIEPSWFFCAALLAFPASGRRKVLGILTGAVLLQALNLLRIVSLYFIGLHYPRLFNTAHVEIWPAMFIIVAIALWVGWIGWSRRPAQSVPHALV